LSGALRGQGISVLHQGADSRYDLAENLPSAWPVRDIVGKTAADALPESLAAEFGQALSHLRQTGDSAKIDFELRDGARRRQFEAHFSPDIDDSGALFGTTIVLTDVTDNRSREAAMTALLREVSHRSKNLLAIVQSVAMQTAHHSGGIQDFLDKFRGRLHALSSTQDLVTESNWRGSYFQSLVAAQLARVGPSILRDLRITGDNPLLSPNASLHIGLAIHELAANAVIHGALSGDTSGHVWVDARVEPDNGDGPAQLIIEWQETGIDATRIRQAPRFGTMVLERIVPLLVGGNARYELHQDRVSYSLTVPADQFEG
jgi:two-component sensor histidine kinase